MNTLLPTESAVPWRKWALAPIFAIPIVFLALDVVGAVSWFSPVPFWDMWDYTIDFDLRTRAGDWGAFFFQANEHRIVVSSMLFWLDNRLFGGESKFLVPANLGLMVCNWVALCFAARPLFKAQREIWLIASLCLAAPCLSWMQEPNIIWGFQSQFFVAYLFPLLTFVCIARSTEGSRPYVWFAAGVGFAVASIGTMANGVLAVPLALMMLALLRAPWPRFAILLTAGAIAIGLWLRHYTLIPHDRPDVMEFFLFMARFLGAPITRAFDAPALGLACGFLFVALSLVYAVRWLRSGQPRNPAALALLMFIAHLGATCAMISFGRAGIEADPTPIHRYATPTVLGWSALLFLIAARFQHWRLARPAYGLLGALLALALFKSQSEVFTDYGPITAHRKLLGALAVGLDTRDWPTIGQIFPVGTPVERERIFRIAKDAAAQRISIFGDPVFARAFSAIGTPASGFHACPGNLDGTTAVPDDARYLRVTGWAYDESAGRKRVPSFVYIAAGDTIVGVAATGQPRRDVAAQHGSAAYLSGFDGYVRADAGQNPRILCVTP